MPLLDILPDLHMYYEVDDFAPPWSERDTVLLLHGNAESGEVWFGWTPHLLAANLRVVRPDMRGFGRSTPMPRDFPWSPDRIADDYVALLDHLGIDRCHVVGAKVGGTMALHMAARHPQRLKSLTVLGPPTRGADTADRYSRWVRQIELEGVESWARSTMGARLGADFPAAGVEWWIKLMGRTALTTQLGFIGTVRHVDVTPALGAIRCPCMVITTADNPLYPVSTVRAWQSRIAHSELLALPGASYHPAATSPRACAAAVVQFITRISDDTET